MFEKVNVPVLGLIENMSYLFRLATGNATTFSGAEAANGKRNGCGFRCFGQIPIDIATREGGDRGMPSAAEDPKSAVGAEFNRIARELLNQLG